VTAAVLAIDGGNSKTDVCLISADGMLLGYARGPGSNHQNIGVDAAFEVLSSLTADASAEAGISVDSTLAQRAAVYLAGADFPVEVAMLQERVSLAGWAPKISLDNGHVRAIASRHAGREPYRCGVWRGHQLRGGLGGWWGGAVPVDRCHLR